MKIRKATMKDIEEIWKIEVEDRRYHKKITSRKYSLLNKNKFGNKEKTEFINSFKKDLKNKKVILLVAEDEKVVGHLMGSFSKWNWSDNPPKIIILNSIGVFSKYRKEGVATKLIKKLEEYSKEKNIKFIYLGHWIKNYIAHELYKKNKFEDFRLEMVKKLK